MSALSVLADVVRLRAQRQSLWLREVWGQLPPGAHPMAVSEAEVAGIVAARGRDPETRRAFLVGSGEASAAGEALQRAEAALAAEPAWVRLVSAFGLSAAEQHLLCCAAALEADPYLGRVYAYLHDQPEWTHATPWLAAELFDGEPVSPGPGSPLRRWQLLDRGPEAGALAEVLHGWTAPASLSAFLRDGAARFAGERTTVPPEPLDPELMGEIVDFAGFAGAAAFSVELAGGPGSGRKTLARQVAARLGLPVHLAGAPGRPDDEARPELLDALRDAALAGAILVWEEPVGASAGLRALLDQALGPVIAVREEPAPGVHDSRRFWRSFAVRSLTRARRVELWSSLSNLPCPPQVRDSVLSPGEIVRLVEVAPAGEEAIRQACRRPAAESIGLLDRLPLPFRRTDLMVGKPIGDLLDAIETQVRLRWDVYEDWGFERLVPNGRGIVALFAGPSGTGKTMAAQVLARSLGLELYRLDASQVVNKYIGETEKRLKIVFDACDRSHFMLLIDECEGLFGKRFDSRDAHDRYANLEIDYLLQRLERFEGVAILSTNRKTDIDAAFLRRFRFVVDFMPPGVAERLAIWKAAIPETSPDCVPLRGDIAWDLLAEKAAITGADIKLAALNAAFLARSRGEPIGMPHIVTALRRELAKKGQVLRGIQ
jgi:adenylate kinase family enzyme